MRNDVFGVTQINTLGTYEYEYFFLIVLGLRVTVQTHCTLIALKTLVPINQFVFNFM